MIETCQRNWTGFVREVPRSNHCSAEALFWNTGEPFCCLSNKAVRTLRPIPGSWLRPCLQHSTRVPVPFVQMVSYPFLCDFFATFYLFLTSKLWGLKCFFRTSSEILRFKSFLIALKWSSTIFGWFSAVLNGLLKLDNKRSKPIQSRCSPGWSNGSGFCLSFFLVACWSSRLPKRRKPLHSAT